MSKQQYQTTILEPGKIMQVILPLVSAAALLYGILFLSAGEVIPSLGPAFVFFVSLAIYLKEKYSKGSKYSAPFLLYGCIFGAFFSAMLTGGEESPMIMWIIPVSLMSATLLRKKTSAISYLFALLFGYWLVHKLGPEYSITLEFIDPHTLYEATIIITTLYTALYTFGYREILHQEAIGIERTQEIIDEHALVSITDLRGVITHVNNKFVKVSGYSENELVGSKHNIVKGDAHPKEFYEEMWKTITDSKIWQGTLQNKKKNGEYYWVQSTVAPYTYNQRGKATQFIAIRSEVTENILLGIKLKESIEKIEKAYAAQHIFMMNMSHELRTPLHGIQGISDLMQDSQLDSTQRENLEQISRSAIELRIVIDDILDFTNLQSGQLILTKVRTNLKKTLQDVYNSLKEEAQAKQLEYKLSISENLPQFLNIDGIRLRQILINLTNNAIKFTQKGNVDIIAHSTELKEGGFDLQFSIQDTGLGIPETEFDAIFESFHQLGNTTTREVGGTGLGLPICQALVQLMGGKIQVESSPKGSCFSFHIHIAASDILEQEIKKPALDSKGFAQAHPLRILIAEDNPVNQLVIKKTLKLLGFTTELAKDGQEALEACLKTEFDVVLMDVMMPRMDGIEATKAIISQLGPKAPLIVALTANAIQQNRQNCLDAGMIDFLTKPVTRDTLKESLAQVYSQIQKNN